jgi:hypothetical protein
MDPYIITQGRQLLPYFFAMKPKTDKPARAAPIIINVSFIRTSPPDFLSRLFSQTNRGWSDLNELIVIDIGYTLLQ